ncbi:MAG: DAK2 domain-containing protein [Anaerovibrio sp.]|uniref:DAK2 domain-containing protein n=1 Tax=Anaerovibrio sp. TaxID=1872532 RepID=UPI0025C44A44|nr:DAK2 domain-containing protein [Anaerovibrio sp.]MBE6099243.1 DAK2 domain-containing protein [Anaerovibrio sp.]
MADANEVITGSDYKRMVLGAYSEFLNEFEKINAVKENSRFFYSGKPGSDVLRTMGAAVIPLSEAVNESIGGLSRRVADASVLGARGNAGVIVSQILRGLAKGLIGKYNATSQEFGKAFQYGILYAQKAVPEEKNRPIIVASKVVAKGAYDAVKAGKHISEVLNAAIQAGTESFARDMDCGEKILQVFLEGCLKGLQGNFSLPPLDLGSKIYEAKGIVSPLNDIARPYCVTFMVANPKLSVPLIEKELQEIGNFVVVERRFKAIFIHVHSEHPGTVLERAVAWGHVGEIHINIMAEPHAMAMVQQSCMMPLALLTVASTEEWGQKLQDAGAMVIIDGSDESGPSVEEIVNAAHSDIANKYILLTDSEHLRLVMHQAKRILGERVSVVVANNQEEQIYAVRAFFPELSMEENTAQMIEAVRKMAADE